MSGSNSSPMVVGCFVDCLLERLYLWFVRRQFVGRYATEAEMDCAKALKFERNKSTAVICKFVSCVSLVRNKVVVTLSPTSTGVLPF